MQAVEPRLVTLDEIRAAADRIRGVAVRTPLLPWDDTAWLKPESLQPIGAFKMRGASSGMQITARVPSSREARATACAWLPDE